SVRLCIEFVHQGIDIFRIVRQMKNCIRPVEELSKLLIPRMLSYHDCPRACSFEIPIPNFNLIASYIGLINQSRVDDKISTSPGHNRQKKSVLLRIDGEIPRYAVVNIKYATFLRHP